MSADHWTAHRTLSNEWVVVDENGLSVAFCGGREYDAADPDGDV